MLDRDRRSRMHEKLLKVFNLVVKLIKLGNMDIQYIHI